MLESIYKRVTGVPRHNPIGKTGENKSDTDKPYQAALKTREDLTKKIQEEIIFSNPILEREGIGIIYPNTINIVQGKTGSHKSRFAELFAACLLCLNINISFLGFRKRTEDLNDFVVLYVDTERNLNDQFPYALKSIIGKSEHPKKPDSFDFLSLLKIERSQRFNVLKQHLDHVRKKHPKHIVVFLDVLTDCIANFNDPKESMKLIDLMNNMINEFNITFICIIHENPGQGEKARGHLGTELQNKASTQIQTSLEQIDDNHVIKIKYMKTRRSKRPDNFYAIYSESERGLIMADSDMVAKVERLKKLKADVYDVAECLMEILLVSMKREDLLNQLMNYFDCSKNTINSRLKEIIENKIQIRGLKDSFFLVKEKIGKEIWYSLEKEEPEPPKLFDKEE